MVFSEDSFNKKLSEDVHSRVLVGNWFEESVLQQTVGEARSVPQRHVKRAGLLKDFTKRPSQPRKLDNTFERVSGSATGSDQSYQFVTTKQVAFAKPDERRDDRAPRQALDEAAFLAAAKKVLDTAAQSPEDGRSRFETEYAASNALAAAAVSGKKKTDSPAPNVPSKWLGKYSEFTHPIELQRRGGPFKDESGIRPSHKNNS